ATELCPAIRASVHASQPEPPSRVRNVCRREYKTNGRTLDSRRAFDCCFFKLDGSKCPLLLGAVHTKPSMGLPNASHRDSRSVRTLGVIGSALRAAVVF